MLMLRKMTTFLFIPLSYPVMAHDPLSSSFGSLQFHGAIVEPELLLSLITKNYIIPF